MPKRQVRTIRVGSKSSPVKPQVEPNGFTLPQCMNCIHKKGPTGAYLGT